jgi:PilZ domain
MIMEEAPVSKRRSLTPSPGIPHGGDVHATRRAGARHEVSKRVVLTPVDAPFGARGEKQACPLDGWALNMSRGGVRVILEQKVELGSVFEVAMIEPSGETSTQVARVVWVQEEPDGVVAGLAFGGDAAGSGPHRNGTSNGTSGTPSHS